MRRRFVADGHLIDSGILASVLNLIIEEQADYEIIEFTMGKTNANTSHLELDLITENQEQMDGITLKLVQSGCYEKTTPGALLKPAVTDGTVPEDFYSTTNHRSEIYHNSEWIPVENQRMDGVIVIKDDHAVCKKLRDVKKGELVVCSAESVRVFPVERTRKKDIFGFMSNEVSSERGVEILIAKIAEELIQVRNDGGKIIAVAGPVVVHTNGSRSLARLIKEGFVTGLLAGNALAVHDVEYELFGTSLGIDLSTGMPTHEGHKNHMRAINRIRLAGSIEKAVADSVLTRGVMYEIVQAEIPYCLAGSIRDDGPLPETETDMNRAQERYSEILKGADIVIMMASMLHAIGTGNMLPSWVKTVCVDINPAVVTKLVDRGSSQTIGIVSDVGLFIRALTQQCLGENRNEL